MEYINKIYLKIKHVYMRIVSISAKLPEQR